MNTTALVLIGYGIGLLVSFLLFRPTKAYKDGFEDAEKLYKNLNGGYHAGCEEVFRTMERRMTEEEALNLLLIMLKCTKDKTSKAAILSSYIQVNGPIPDDYAEAVLEEMAERERR